MPSKRIFNSDFAEVRTLSLGLLLLSPAFLLSQDDRQSRIGDLQAQRLSVAKVRVHRKKGGAETAAAIFVGKDQRNAYFATVYHAVAPITSIESVEVQFYTSPQRFPGTVLDLFDEALDLAVLQTAVGNLPSAVPELPIKDAAADVAVHIVGHPSAGDWSIWTGHVQNENAPAGDVHHFTTNRDESLTDGYSGGPVFDSQGNLLGIHTSTIAKYAQELKSPNIVAQLRAWRVPTNNVFPAGVGRVRDSNGTSGDTAGTTGSSGAAQRAWQLINDSTDPKDFETFAREFKDDSLAHVAVIRAGQLRAKRDQEAEEKIKDHDDQMKKCYAVARTSCMRDCVDNYHFNRTDCSSKFCSLEKNEKYWNELCTHDIDGRGKRF